MGWINADEQLPPEGLQVLVEVSGSYSGNYSMFADHDFYIASWIKPEREKGFWLIYDETPPGTYETEQHLIDPKVFAWMPLPKHYQPKEHFKENGDMMEHALFEDDPGFLYKGDFIFEQMSIEEFLQGHNKDERGTG